MDFQNTFPIWKKLNTNQKNRILGGLISRKVKNEEIIRMSCGTILILDMEKLKELQNL